MSLMLQRGPMLRRHGPPPVMTLADYYGTGPGQIPIDLRLDDPSKMTLSGSLVQAVANDGGAGAVFNATAAAGEEPSVVTGGVDFVAPPTGSGVTRRLVMPYSADLQGVHFLCPFTAPQTTLVGFVASGPDSFTIPTFRNSSANHSIRVGNNITFPHVTTPQDMTVSHTVWHLFEIRIAGGRFKVWLDGVLKHDLSCSTAAHPIHTIGSSTTATNRWTQKLGRLISVVTPSATTNYPAVTLARERIATDLGITLP